jgi:hypothetical protein
MKNGEHLLFINIVWHNIIRNMYEKEEYNKQKMVKHAKNPAFSGFHPLYKMVMN